MKKTILLFAFIFVYNLANSQVIKNSYIIDLKKGTSDLFKIEQQYLRSTQNQTVKTLSSTLDIIQVTFDNEENREFESWLDNHKDVESWGYNYYVQKRLEPNDQYFDQQWGLSLINAPEAWEVTTGGFDINGNEIVVAVLDDSYDLDHPDLEGRIFVNEGEIPDDGIDNDNNGYIDDYQGWNTTNETDNHPLTDNHGIAVCGIIGANTNNGIGMAGINWQVKMIPISGIATQAEVISGYQYALNMRKRYNDTNGEEGAYVVVTNYSAGINNAFGTEPQFKAWCDMYDAMGSEGILSVGATANANTDVDAEGDMPTTCPSPFLISVTNTDINDTKVSGAGFGLENIDLGAPGNGTLTLDRDDGYDPSFGGTSASTPHVAGTVALLYSVPCSRIAELAEQSPRQAAEIIREAIYSGVSSNNTLDGITATGGRLDIFGAIEALQESCDELELPSVKGDLEIVKIDRSNSQSLFVEYITPDETQYSLMVTDGIGRTIRHFDFTPPSFGRKELQVEIAGLIPGIYFISIYNQDTISTQKVFVD